MKTRVREAAARWSLALLSILITVAAVEGALRLAPSAKRYHVWPPHTHRVWRPPPDIFPGIEGTGQFTTNSEGIRGREFGADGEEYRILAIGGSATEGGDVDDSETWVALVEQRLGHTADGRTTWVGNVGRSGMNSLDHVLQVDQLTAQYPRIETLLILVGVNDLTVALAQGEHYAAPPPLSDPKARQTRIERAFAVAPGQFLGYVVDEPSIAPPWYKNTATWQLLRNAKRSVEMRLGHAMIEEDTSGVNLTTWRKRRQSATVVLDQLPNLSAPLTDYRGNLRAIADLATARGKRLIFMTQPTIWRGGLPRGAAQRCWLGGTGDFQHKQASAYYSLEALAEAMRLFNDALLEVCRERGIEAIDLASEIPKDESAFYDDAHFTQAGERLVAGVVAAHLARLPPYARADSAS